MRSPLYPARAHRMDEANIATGYVVHRPRRSSICTAVPLGPVRRDKFPLPTPVFRARRRGHRARVVADGQCGDSAGPAGLGRLGAFSADSSPMPRVRGETVPPSRITTGWWNLTCRTDEVSSYLGKAGAGRIQECDRRWRVRCITWSATIAETDTGGASDGFRGRCRDGKYGLG